MSREVIAISGTDFHRWEAELRTAAGIWLARVIRLVRGALDETLHLRPRASGVSLFTHQLTRCRQSAQETNEVPEQAEGYSGNNKFAPTLNTNICYPDFA